MTKEERQKEIKKELQRNIERFPNDTIIIYTSTTKTEEDLLGCFGLLVGYISQEPTRKGARHEFALFNKWARCGRIVAISTPEERKNGGK